MTEEQAFHYVGQELQVAAFATNWKRYWASIIAPYLGRRVLEVGAGLGANTPHLCSSYQQYWLALEPDPALAASITARKCRGELPSQCFVRIGALADLQSVEAF